MFLYVYILSGTNKNTTEIPRYMCKKTEIRIRPLLKLFFVVLVAFGSDFLENGPFLEVRIQPRKYIYGRRLKTSRSQNKVEYQMCYHNANEPLIFLTDAALELYFYGATVP